MTRRHTRLEGDSVAGIDDLRAELKQDFDAMREAIAGMRAEVAALNATLSTRDEQRTLEMNALFSRTDDHGRRISSIEASYLPRGEYRADQDAVKRDIAGHAEKIGTLSVSVGKLVAIASLIGGAAGIVGQIAVRLLAN